MGVALASVRIFNDDGCPPREALTARLSEAEGLPPAQGLSEPLGALIALVAVKPFVSEEPLHYVLAFVGGIMVRLPVTSQNGQSPDRVPPAD